MIPVKRRKTTRTMHTRGKNSEEIVRIRVHTTSLKFLLNQAFVHLCFVYAKYTSMDYYNIAEKTGLEKSSA